jgi:hypothetical protein
MAPPVSSLHTSEPGWPGAAVLGVTADEVEGGGGSVVAAVDGGAGVTVVVVDGVAGATVVVSSAASPPEEQAATNPSAVGRARMRARRAAAREIGTRQGWGAPRGSAIGLAPL